jgi:hypothetical protein
MIINNLSHQHHMNLLSHHLLGAVGQSSTSAQGVASSFSKVRSHGRHERDHSALRNIEGVRNRLNVGREVFG